MKGLWVITGRKQILVLLWAAVALLIVWNALVPWPDGFSTAVWYGAMLSLIVFVIVNLRMVISKSAQVTALLNTQCDPEAFEAAARPIIAACGTYERTRDFYKLMTVVSMLDRGAEDAARALFSSLGEKKIMRRNKSNMLTLRNLRCVFYLYDDRVDLAKQEYAQVERFVNNYKKRRGRLGLISFMYLMDASIQFHLKNYDDCIVTFESVYNGDNNTPMRMKVSAAYRLGVIWASRGETGKAKTYYAFAGENGNKLYAARRAKEMLLAMGDASSAAR